MMDRSAGLRGSQASVGIGTLERKPVEARYLEPAASRAIVPIVWLLIFAYYVHAEGPPATVLFTAGTTLAIAAALVLATRRVLFATVVTGALIALIVAVSRAKLEAIGMVLHAYDFVFYLTSWSTLCYLWEGARSYVVALLAGLVLATLVAWLAYRVDATRVSRRYAAAAFIVFILLAAAGSASKGERPHTLFYWEALHVSSFFSSWSETLETLWRGQLIEADPEPATRTLAVPVSCQPRTKPPHIILIHEESLVQPSLFPTLQYDRGLDRFFQSADGKVHQLAVETYGGASWLTEFSILAGISTRSFGGMRPFVQSLLAGKVHETVPELLARCGYRNVMFYPMLKNFVSNERFYESIGLGEIFDLKAQGAQTTNERDRFYFDNAMAEMKRHIAKSDAPLFTYIQTMSAHWPYNVPFHPEINVAGGGPGTNPEMHEYLRRVGIAKLDYEYLKSELQQRFPGEPILIVHYGDHQPVATRTLLGFKESSHAEDIDLGPDSRGLITYYAVDAINYVPHPLPRYAKLDVAYLGAVILEQTGLPLSDAWRERLRLMAICQGRYYNCRQRGQIQAFHRRLIDSGLVEAR